MARYGKGGYNEWKENRVTSYDKKTEGAALGLKGWEGNKIIEHSAKQLAEKSGKSGVNYGKGTIYWDAAENQLIRDARNGDGSLGGYFAQKNEDEIADLREQLESRNIENKEAKAAVEEIIPYEAPEDSKEYKQAEDRSNAYRQNLNNLLSSLSQTKFDKSSQKYLNDYKIDLIADHQKRKEQEIEQDLV